MELLALTGAAVQPLLLDSGSDTEPPVQNVEDGELRGSTHYTTKMRVFFFTLPALELSTHPIEVTSLPEFFENIPPSLSVSTNFVLPFVSGDIMGGAHLHAATCNRRCLMDTHSPFSPMCCSHSHSAPT